MKAVTPVWASTVLVASALVLQSAPNADDPMETQLLSFGEPVETTELDVTRGGEAVVVKLNNNQIGRVVGANKLYPTRPLVEVLLDHRGKRVKAPMLVHLEEEPMLYIVDPAMDESVLDDK